MLQHGPVASLFLFMPQKPIPYKNHLKLTSKSIIIIVIVGLFRQLHSGLIDAASQNGIRWTFPTLSKHLRKYLYDYLPDLVTFEAYLP